ncbi:DUF819 domain-containing protein [Pseudoxanthomonas spadix]|uniref:DUF819 family protein n=1 Tax=Pseudoxanthomonas spadix TaxID=415229 RepID=UPI000EFE113B|nr:DUF819 family protein [Pseudoxanthomonas spadix]MBP3974337.1 DUF819 family protein [Pseudoxanthomonas spadix]RMW97469.1 DUF819 family protein [Pseudoxanthomonas spadix]
MPDSSHALIQNDIVLFGLIAATLALVFWTASLKGFWQKFYGVVPPLLLCYFIPGIFNSIGLIDGTGSQLYNPIASRVLLPAALVLLTLTIDLKAVMGLGWKLLAMYFGASLSIMLGAFVAFWVMQHVHPQTTAGDTWGGMAALAGSWIGGGANMVAMKEIFEVDETTFGQFVVLDVGVGYVWMAVLIFLAGRAKAIDARAGAETAAIETLKQRLAAYNAQHARIPTQTDFMLIIGLAFGVVGLAHAVSVPLAGWFAPLPWAHRISLDSPYVWVVLLATLAGLGLSFTRARQLDGAGASKIGTLLLYVLIASIGMQMDIGAVLARPWLFVLGIVWMAVHIVLLWGLGRLLKAPLFYFAMGSQSNIGGPASAPVVAAVFHPALAPIGALLGTLGYATGTVLAYLVGIGLRAMAGAG